jgi:hypothetical protein
LDDELDKCSSLISPQARADDGYLPEAVAQDERIQRLAILTSLINGLTNDATSVSKEDTGPPLPHGQASTSTK